MPSICLYLYLSLSLALGLLAACSNARQQTPTAPVTYQPGNGNGGDDTTTGAWFGLVDNDGPSARIGHTAAFGDGCIFIYGGEGANGVPLMDGSAYDLSQGSWEALSINNAPIGRRDHAAVWTSSGLVVWGGIVRDPITGAIAPTDTGAVYDRAGGHWNPMSTDNAPTARSGHTAVSTGTTMIVWGGLGDTVVDTGAIYKPLTNRWSPTTVKSAPAARTNHTAVWTGQQMLIWGGTSDQLEATGGIYDPAHDAWTAISTKDAPAARRSHAAAWAGGRMVVFGGVGQDQQGQPLILGDGGVYDPTTDTWSPMSATNAPAPRVGHTGIAGGGAGTLFLVFGGQSDLVLDDGGVYDVTQNSWLPLSPRPIDQRTGHTAVWTGTQMMMWGGYDGTDYIAEGDFFQPSN